MCHRCQKPVEDYDGFNLCESCIFEMVFVDKDNLKKIVVDQFDELQGMLKDHKEMSNINEDSEKLVLSVHRHLQGIKKVVEAL